MIKKIFSNFLDFLKKTSTLPYSDYVVNPAIDSFLYQEQVEAIKQNIWFQLHNSSSAILKKSSDMANTPMVSTILFQNRIFIPLPLDIPLGFDYLSIFKCVAEEFHNTYAGLFITTIPPTVILYQDNDRTKFLVFHYHMDIATKNISLFYKKIIAFEEKETLKNILPISLPKTHKNIIL